jgi:hypothetical protein
MTRATDTEENRAKVKLVERCLIDLLGDVLQPGVYGSAALEIAVQDGTIQHVRRRWERIER